MTAKPPPIGDLKKIVTLVDRTDFDNYVYPSDAKTTRFQPKSNPYHNYTKETVVWPFAGGPSWGQRVTFSVPWPWQGDFLNWIALRLKPLSWLPADAQRRIGPEKADWVPIDSDAFWVWANSLGTAAIALAEMEVDGVIVESFSGDWLTVWNKMSHDVSSAVPFDDAAYGSYAQLTVNNIKPSEDGFIYCYLPFWFSKFQNTGFPLLSCSGPDRVRFHITFRPFSEVVRKLKNPKGCAETPNGQSFQVRDYSFPFRKFTTVTSPLSIPTFETADILCGISHIDGELREAYIRRPHELLMSPVVETVFNEPLKYLVTSATEKIIQIGLPLTEANGPIRQIVFFLRRKDAVEHFNDYTNFSATLTTATDPVWNPEQPLLQRAQLLVGTAVWADEGEAWWRSNINLPGGIRASGKYIYSYTFADKPTEFAPSGSLNASRVDMRLNLWVKPIDDVEWTVRIFYIGTNWMRFENGLANVMFMD